jgi:copper chaperone CopZ
MNILNKMTMMLCIASTSLTICEAQVKNAKTETVKIYGNCGMCETTIETAGNIKKVAKVDWDKDTKMTVITYDSTKTNQDEILKRIALVGYDSDKFLAPDDVYNKLHGCCQYERVNKTAVVQKEVAGNLTSTQNQETTAEPKQDVNQLKAIFENYFALKDALVKADGNSASTIAKDLLSNISSVKMDKLSTEEHTVWMKVMKDLAFDAGNIEKVKDVVTQRNSFTSLSKNVYSLLKVSKQETTIYYQNCPMFNDGKGANWLSKESTIKNPYYGSQMISCGKTVETIK